MKTIKIPNLKALFSKKTKTKPPVRQHPETEFCVLCNMGLAMIYDQNHDCCTTCKRKWEISDESLKEK